MIVDTYADVLRKITETFRDNDTDGQKLFQLATPSYSFEVLVENESTSLKVWVTSTGEHIMALGWPFADDIVDDSHIIDVITELGSFVQLARRDKPPRTIH